MVNRGGFGDILIVTSFGYIGTGGVYLRYCAGGSIVLADFCKWSRRQCGICIDDALILFFRASYTAWDCGYVIQRLCIGLWLGTAYRAFPLGGSVGGSGRCGASLDICSSLAVYDFRIMFGYCSAYCIGQKFRDVKGIYAHTYPADVFVIFGALPDIRR